MVTGGNILNDLILRDNSEIEVYGGYIFDDIIGINDSQIKIYGDFASYGVFTGVGHLTGILSNGQTIDNDYFIADNAKLILVPEPVTLSILAVGALTRYRRKR